MKRIFNALLFTGMAFYSASASVEREADSTKLVKAPKSDRFLYGLNYTLTSGSNGLNQKMMNWLGFGGYKSPVEIRNAETKLKTINRAGYLMKTEITVGLEKPGDTALRKKWRFRPTSLGLSQFSAVGADYDLGAYQLVFRGNEHFLGQSLEFGNSGFQQFSSRTFEVGFNNALIKNSADTRNQVSFKAGISQLLAYRNLKFTDGVLFTDSNRNYIDVRYSAQYNNAGKNAWGGVGVGLVTGVTWAWQAPKNRGYIHLSNAGIYYIPQMQKLEKVMDSSVRINQTTLGIKSLNSDDWIGQLRDTVNSGLAPDSAMKSGFVLAPFNFVVSLITKNMRVTLDYTYIRGYVPRLTFAPAKPVARYGICTLTPDVQFGGFDNFNLNLKLGFATKPNSKSNTLSGFLKFQGIEGMLAPGRSHGAGVIFGVQYFAP